MDDPLLVAGWETELGGNVQALFFEGELGEILPGLDPDDTGTWDWGFSVGRQPLVVQDGLLVDDVVDMAGLTRNSLIAPDVSNLRLTGIFGWSDVNRGDNRAQDDAFLVGLLGAADVRDSTVSLDALYVGDQGGDSDAWYLGLGSVQRYGTLNTTFRAAGSLPVHGDSAAAGGGAMLFTELSRTPRGSDDLLYANAFLVLDDFTSAARGDDRGGPEKRTGILFEPVGMGRYGIPLDGPLSSSLGAALGYQSYLDGVREQVVLELGARESTRHPDQGQVGLGARYQRAFGRRFVLRADAFGSVGEGREPGLGLRLEWVVEF